MGKQSIALPKNASLVLLYGARARSSVTGRRGGQAIA